MSVAGCLEILDKGFVDLEGGEGKELEVAEGRVAGAEIIDGNGNPHFLEHEEHLPGLIGLLHHHPFGQFEFEMVGGEARFSRISRILAPSFLKLMLLPEMLMPMRQSANSPAATHFCAWVQASRMTQSLIW